MAGATWLGSFQTAKLPSERPSFPGNTVPQNEIDGGLPSVARSGAGSGAGSDRNIPPALSGTAGSRKAEVSTRNDSKDVAIITPTATSPSRNSGGETVSGIRQTRASSGSLSRASGGLAGGSGYGGNQSLGVSAANNTDSGAAATSEVEIPVPVGEGIPAVFYDETPLPAPQQRALDRIAEEFNANISTPDGSPPSSDVWQQAKATADRQYITLFGFRKYNEISLAAAREALREKKVANPVSTQP